MVNINSMYVYPLASITYTPQQWNSLHASVLLFRIDEEARILKLQQQFKITKWIWTSLLFTNVGQFYGKYFFSNEIMMEFSIFFFIEYPEKMFFLSRNYLNYSCKIPIKIENPSKYDFFFAKITQNSFSGFRNWEENEN